MLNVQFQVCNKWRKNAIVRAIFLFSPFVVRSCHKHSFLHASFFCLAVSARNLTVPVIPLSISFRLSRESRAFPSACSTCLSPMQRVRRGRAFFRFLPFHAAFGERDAPWLFTLYCPRPVARFFLPVASPPRAFFLLVSFLCLAVSARNLLLPVISLSISFRLFLEPRAFPSACSTCLSPMQRVRRGRAFFRFLSFHAAFGERNAPWLLLLYGCAAFPFGKSGELGL